MINFAALHERYPLIFYDTLVAGHKALGHQVYDTFWNTTCRNCGWRADVWTKNGNPFNPNSNATFVVTTG